MEHNIFYSLILIKDTTPDQKELVERSMDLGSLVEQASRFFASIDSESRSIEYWVEAPDRLLFQTHILGLSPIISPMINLIVKYHAGQTRKGDGHPYLEHPLEVGQILYNNHFSPEIIAAGYGHDLLEGTECPPQLILTECGDRVFETINAVSHDSHEKDWEKKKRDYIRKVEEGGVDAIAVSVADKIANLSSFIREYQVEGVNLWKNFNRGKQSKLWFENAVLKMARKNWNHPMLDEYSRLIQVQSELPE